MQLKAANKFYGHAKPQSFLVKSQAFFFMSFSYAHEEKDLQCSLEIDILHEVNVGKEQDL